MWRNWRPPDRKYPHSRIGWHPAALVGGGVEAGEAEGAPRDVPPDSDAEPSGGSDTDASDYGADGDEPTAAVGMRI